MDVGGEIKQALGRCAAFGCTEEQYVEVTRYDHCLFHKDQLEDIQKATQDQKHAFEQLEQAELQEKTLTDKMNALHARLKILDSEQK